MATYTFTTENSENEQEELGSLELTDDAAAVIFAKNTLRDILNDNPRDYAGWMLIITQAGRPIAGLSYLPPSRGAN